MIKNCLALAALLTPLAGCATANYAGSTRPVAFAALNSAAGAPAATADIREVNGQIILTVIATSMPPGPHGLHLHMVGKCDAPGFTSAGGHLNPAGHQHGSENPAGSHLGDLPNLVADASGKGRIEAPLSGDAGQIEAALFDADGSAIVIHASADDYRTDPSGNSGARIACGVLQRR